MVVYSKLCFGAAIAMLAATSTSAQTKPAGDQDDQFVISGGVVHAKDVRGTGPQSLMGWSKGDVYLASPTVGVKPSATANPVGTTGTTGTLFYWLEDENDFAR